MLVMLVMLVTLVMCSTDRCEFAEFWWCLGVCWHLLAV
jgi:hypothetical protein